MAKAYLNVLLKADGEKLSTVKAHIGPKPGWLLGAEQLDCFWSVVLEREAVSYEAARKDVEFTLERADFHKLGGLVLLRRVLAKPADYDFEQDAQ